MRYNDEVRGYQRLFNFACKDYRLGLRPSDKITLAEAKRRVDANHRHDKEQDVAAFEQEHARFAEHLTAAKERGEL